MGVVQSEGMASGSPDSIHNICIYAIIYSNIYIYIYMYISICGGFGVFYEHLSRYPLSTSEAKGPLVVRTPGHQTGLLIKP